MRWKGPAVLLLCLISLCNAQRHRRRDHRDRPSGYQEPRESSREHFGDYSDPRGGRDFGNDYDYEENSNDPPRRNLRSDRGGSFRKFDSRDQRDLNQIPDYDFNGGGYNSRRKHHNVQRTGYNNGRAPKASSGGAPEHDDFADYSLGISFEVPEGRQGAFPPHGPEGPPLGPRPRHDARRRGVSPDTNFESFGSFGRQGREVHAPQPEFGRQGNGFGEAGPHFRNEFNAPPRQFGGDEFREGPLPVENAGPNLRFRGGEQFDRPPFNGPRRPPPIHGPRGPLISGGFGQPPVREFLSAGDNEITPAMLAELEAYGLGSLAGPVASPSRPAPRPVPRPAPQPPPPAPAPLPQIHQAVAGVEARQASLEAVQSSDGRSATINSKVKDVDAENITTSDNDNSESNEPIIKNVEKGNKNITVVKATEILGAAAVTSTNESTTAATANTTAQPFLLTTTGLPVGEEQANATSLESGVRVPTYAPDTNEMTTIPVTIPPTKGKGPGYKKRSSFLLSNVAKRKISPEYNYLKAFHSVYRGYVKKGGREACSMCAIEYCLNTCSHVLKPTCAGVDYNFETKTCTVHSKDEICATLVPEGRTTHYVHMPCDKGLNTEPLPGSETGETAVLKTTPSPADGHDDVTEDEGVTENPPSEDNSPGGKIDSKQGVLGTPDSKTDDFTFVDEKSDPV